MTNATDYPLANFVDVAVVLTSTLIGLVALSAGLEGFFKTKINVIFRVILIISAVMLIVPEGYTDIIGVVIAILVLIINYMKWKKEEPLPSH